jgi:UDPglucose 6-dehydrogenase
VIRDVLAERIDALREGRMPFHEVDVPELMERNAGRLTYTLDVRDVADCEFLFVCVGTPPTYSGDADLSGVWTVIDELPELRDRTVLVMKSTVPVGTGEKVRAGLDERGLEHVGYVSNPEFLAEGNAVRDFMSPDRIVVGAYEDADAAAVARLYESVEGPLVQCDVNSAEMIKLAANAFLMTRISFINEIANVCEATGADVVKVAEGVGLDHRLGPHFLRAGIGYGGSCFPKDSLALKQLASNSGYHFQLLSAVIEVNELQKRRVIGKLTRHLGPLRGRTVALLGLAFKPDTDDMREAPSIVLASRLLAEGATVRAWDPVADGTTLPRGVEVVDSVLEAVRGADAAVIVTEWRELRELASPEVRAAMATPLIIDGRNLLDPDAVRKAGFAYEGIGRPTSATDVFPETVLLVKPEPSVELPAPGV